MNAKIGVMKKRVNSTKTDFSGTTHNVVLRDSVSRETPVLLVTGAPMQYSNYMFFNGWYYWIDDVISVTNNMYKVVAHVDPLATWKDDIKASNGYCNFGPKSKYNKKLLDSRLNPDILSTTSHTEVTFDKFSASGSVVLRVVSYSGSKGVQTICGTISDFNELLNDYSSDLNDDLSNISSNFEKLIGKFAGLGNALDSIKSAVWVPIELSELQNGGYAGDIGGYTISGTWYNCKLWSGCPVNETKSVSIPLSNRTAEFPWLIHPKYTQLEMVTPGGKIDLSSATYLMLNTNSIDLDILYGININGEAYITVKDADNGMIINNVSWDCSLNLLNYVYKAKTGIEAGIQTGIKIGLLGTSAIAAFGGAMSAVGTAVGERGLNKGSEAMLNKGISMIDYGDDLTNTYTNKNLSNGITGVANALDITTPNTLFGGQNGLNGYYLYNERGAEWCRIEFKEYMPRCIFSGMYEDFCDEYGWPVYNYVSPDVDGQYQFSGMNVEANAPAAELAIINSTCNSLIYIE